MSEPTLEEKLTSIKSHSDQQLQDLAAVYAEILGEMDETVVKARSVVLELPPTVRGIAELKQLLQIMDGGFVKIAKDIIQTAAEANAEEPSE